MEAPPPFQLFGPGHLTAIGLIIATSVAFPWWIARHGEPRRGRLVDRWALILASIVLLHRAVEIGARVWIYDWPWKTQLPLHLCGASVLLVAVVLLWRWRPVYEVVYFWGIGGATQALLTPDLPFALPHPLATMFFISHGLIIVGVIYATRLFGLRPTWGSVWRALLATNLFAIFVGFANWLLDTNYLYLRHKPEQSSLLDVLGPWPWYIGSLEVLALVLFILCWLPFPILDKLRGSRPLASGG